MLSKQAADYGQLALNWDMQHCPTACQPAEMQLHQTQTVSDTVCESLLVPTPELAGSNPATVAVSAMQHPQANRQIVLEQHALGYVLQRRRRRSIGMRISPQGLLVAAPPWVAIHEIEQILHTKARWILRKLHEQEKLSAAKQQQEQIVWQNGVYLPWQGGLLQVRLTGGAGQYKALRASYLQQKADAAQLLCKTNPDLHAATPASSLAQSILQMDLPENMAGETLCNLVRYWMQQHAYTLFAERLNHYAPQMGVRWSSLKLSNAASRWGSATSQGGIRLHWRLVQLPMQLLDYVVVHELAHLHEMNHSTRFWGWVEKILPDYRQRQFQLKQTSLSPW